MGSICFLGPAAHDLVAPRPVGVPRIAQPRGMGLVRHCAVDVVSTDFQFGGPLRGDMEGELVAFASAIDPLELQPISVFDVANTPSVFGTSYILGSLAVGCGGRQDLTRGIPPPGCSQAMFRRLAPGWALLFNVVTAGLSTKSLDAATLSQCPSI